MPACVAEARPPVQRRVMGRQATRGVVAGQVAVGRGVVWVVLVMAWGVEQVGEVGTGMVAAALVVVAVMVAVTWAVAVHVAQARWAATAPARLVVSVAQVWVTAPRAQSTGTVALQCPHRGPAPGWGTPC